MLRPFSEKRGLRADQLRLQREDVLLEIARKARQRASEENAELNPLPNKFLVPFLERASTEDLKSTLIDRWAALLVSASRTYSSRYLLYTSILANLGPEDVTFMEAI